MKSSNPPSSLGKKQDKSAGSAYVGAASRTNDKTSSNTTKQQQQPPPKMKKKKAPPPPPVMFRLHSPQVAFGAGPAATAAAEDGKDNPAEEIASVAAVGEKKGSTDADEIIPPLAAVTSTDTEQQANNNSKKAKSDDSSGSKKMSHVLLSKNEDGTTASASVAAAVTKKKTTVTPRNEPTSTSTSDANNSSSNDVTPKSSFKHKESSSSKQQIKSTSTSIIPSGLFDESDSDAEEEEGDQGEDASKRTRTAKGKKASSIKIKKPNPPTPTSEVVPSKDSKQRSSTTSSRRQSRSASTLDAENPAAQKVAGEKDVSSEVEGKETTSTKGRHTHKPAVAAESPVMVKSPQKKTKRDVSTVAKELISNMMEEREQEEKDEPPEEAKVGEKKNTKRKREEEEEENEENEEEGCDSTSNNILEKDNKDNSDSSSPATTTTRRSERSNMFRGLLSDASMDYQAIAHAIIVPRAATASSSSSQATAPSNTTPKSTKKKRPPQPSLSNPPPSPALPKSKTKTNAKKAHNTNKQVKLLSWEEKIALLQAHKDKYKSCDLKRAPKDEVLPTLFSFVNESRKQYKRLMRKQHTTMTKERIATLEKMGFDFNPLESGLSQENRDMKTQQQWDAKFADLEEYKAKHGDCLVSCLAEETLGNWVRRQRKLYNRVGRDGFPPDRLARLEAIGFDFDPVRSGTSMAKKRAKMFPRVNANWEKHYNRLKKFKETLGHLVIGPNTKGWAGLYHWVHVQRKEYKKFMAGEDALMHEQWITKMNDLGFNWAPMASENYSTSVMRRHSEFYKDVWNKHYQDLLRFIKKNKHFPTGKGNGELRNWLNDQRRYKRRNEKGLKTPLTDERIKLLDDVGFDWEGNQAVEKTADEKEASAPAVSQRKSLSRTCNKPDADKTHDGKDDTHPLDTSEVAQDFGMSDSVVELGGEDGLAAEAEMVLDNGEMAQV